MSLPSFHTNQRVGDGTPAFVSRFHWRAKRHNRRLNRLLNTLVFPSFRYEVVPKGKRWAVVAFQNVAVGPENQE